MESICLLIFYFILGEKYTLAFSTTGQMGNLMHVKDRRFTTFIAQPAKTKLSRSIKTLNQASDNSEDDKKTLSFAKVMQPWKVDIPEEYKKQIIEAEANTPAGKGRVQRMIFYVARTVLFFSLTTGNLFFTALREVDEIPTYAEDLNNLNEMGFEWVTNNFINRFFLLNGIGGVIALFLTGLFGTMAELEVRCHCFHSSKDITRLSVRLHLITIYFTVHAKSNGQKQKTPKKYGRSLKEEEN